jgi:radical SAM superfamily enzyme YgiQ (UPF0313 family)
MPNEFARRIAAEERWVEPMSRFGAYRIALGFPNSYQIGMSNLGFQWVYRLFNRIPDLACERFFFEPDQAAETFETGTALAEFGVLAWSLSWEMDYVNLLKTLGAAGIPLRRIDRDARHPLMIVGGDCARINPTPLVPFIDVFAMGDGERLVGPISGLLKSGLDREAFLEAAARVPGLFVPAHHGSHAEYAEGRKIVVQQPMSRTEIEDDFEVPHSTILTRQTELADKLLIEISRGCTEMCKFCWAAYAFAPVKQYPARSILAAAAAARPLTDRTGLIATAVCDHPQIDEILGGLADLGYHIALSSIKIDAIRTEILKVLARQGERALAIAPEAGNERLRRAVNKKVTDAELLEKVRLIFDHGFTHLKLYLQVGLPGESWDDVRDLVRMVRALRDVGIAEGGRRGIAPTLVPSVNAFIPKPQTPFENAWLEAEDSLREKLDYLAREFGRMPNVRFRGMPLSEAIWEAYLAKMDEGDAEVLERAADGIPVRRLLRQFRDRIDPVVHAPRHVSYVASADRPHWKFVAKR